MRASLTTLVVIVAALPGATPLAGQSLADRIAGVRDGTVRLSFATRASVCGNGEFVGFDLPDAFYSYGTGSNGYWVNVMHDVMPDCDGGPLRLVVVKSGGRVTALRAAVGVRWRASATAVDLGVVSAPAAAEWLMGLAEADDDVARTALLAAAAADSARLTDRVLDLARNRARSTAARERGIRWAAVVGGAEGRSDEVDRALRAIAGDADESTGVRERAIRDLRATAENRAYLRSLYGRLATPALRERILREIGSDGDDDEAAWIRGVALDGTERVALRERAIRVLGEQLNRPAEVRALFARLDDRALRERALRVAVERGGREELAWARGVAEARREDATVRARAIRLLAERGELEYLKGVYPRLDRPDLKEQVLRAVAERRDADAAAWLAEIVLSESEQVGLRDRAARSLAETGAPSGELATLYDRVTSSVVKRRLIRLLAERRDDAAAGKLAAIAADDPDATLRREAERRRK